MQLTNTYILMPPPHIIDTHERIEATRGATKLTKGNARDTRPRGHQTPESTTELIEHDVQVRRPPPTR